LRVVGVDAEIGVLAEQRKLFDIAHVRSVEEDRARGGLTGDLNYSAEIAVDLTA